MEWKRAIIRRLRRLAAICVVAVGLQGCADEPAGPPTRLRPNAAPTAPGTLKVLAIGNSFSRDAIEQNLYELAAEAGVPMVIANAYIGGCGLDMHLVNLMHNAPRYVYRKIPSERPGEYMDEYADVSLAQILADEAWDVVSLQQSSAESGRYETYGNLGELIRRVRGEVPGARMAWHMTWAYPAGSDAAGFAAYGRNQGRMYDAILDCAHRAMADHPELEVLIPTGTAIQLGRESELGDTFNRDGKHLEATYGRYLAACVWLEALTGVDPRTLTYAPPDLAPDVAALCRDLAHSAFE